MVPWGEARRARGARNQIFIDSGSILGSTPIQKQSVLQCKTDIFKVSIRRKRILESQHYHFVEKWIWESQNFHFAEQKDLGKSKLPFRRKKKGMREKPHVHFLETNWKTYHLSRTKFGPLGFLNTVSCSQTHIFTNRSTGPMTADNQTVFEICSHAAPA